MKNILTCSVLLVTTLAFSAHAQDSLPNDAMQKISSEELQFLVTECEACHGKGGKSTNQSIPSLAGKSAESILQSVEQFYFYERHCPNAKTDGDGPKSGARNMCDVADRLTKQEVLAIGEYFESQ